MAKVERHWLKMLGFNSQGDLGGITFYTDRFGQLVAFAKAPPLNPPTPLQQHQRNRFRAAAVVWNRLTNQERSKWKKATAMAGLRISGYNFFTYWQLTGDNEAVRTIENQTGLDLLT